MIPAAVLTLAAAGGVTLSVVATGSGYDATATYAFTGGGMSYAARNLNSPRAAMARSLDVIAARCRTHASSCAHYNEHEAAKTWRRRSSLLREMRINALVLWPIAAEVAS